MGGSSEERAISLASGCEVAAALRARGHEVVTIDAAFGAIDRAAEDRIRQERVGRAEAPIRAGSRPGVLLEAEVIHGEDDLARADVAFLALHGGAGEDGTVQTLLETAGIAYVGSRPVGCALAMDKDLTKRLLRDAAVDTPKWLVGRSPLPPDEVAGRLGLPLVVKPASGGSSVRLTLARSIDEIAAGAEWAAEGGDRVLYEACVEGREFTVGVLGEEALPVVEIEFAHDFFDFECKYDPGLATETAPAEIPGSLAESLQETALLAHRLLRLEHFSRIDFIVDRSGRPWCLEANALPGLTANSLVPKAALAAGLDFPELCERICAMGRERAEASPVPHQGVGRGRVLSASRP